MEGLGARERAVFTFMVLTHEKLLKPYADYFRETLSPMQLNVLGLLGTYGTMTMTGLSEKLHTTRQQMTQIVTRLFELEFVERQPDEKDRRLIKIRMTEKAEALLHEGAFRFVQDILDRAEQLGDSEKLLEAMETVSRILPCLGEGPAG
jgi:DNA-binding MarR family transcriptional regulator